MGDNLTEKVIKFLLNRGRWVLFAYNWDRKKCPLYRVAGCPLFRGCLSIEVNGRTVGTFRIVHYIMGIRCWGMSIKWGFTVFHVWDMNSLLSISVLTCGCTYLSGFHIFCGLPWRLWFAITHMKGWISPQTYCSFHKLCNTNKSHWSHKQVQEISSSSTTSWNCKLCTCNVAKASQKTVIKVCSTKVCFSFLRLSQFNKLCCMVKDWLLW